jgi:hypothetical protein
MAFDPLAELLLETEAVEAAGAGATAAEAFVEEETAGVDACVASPN